MKTKDVDIKMDVVPKIRYLNKLLNKDFDNKLEKYGLTHQQGRVVIYIYCRNVCDNEIVTQKDLETHFKLSKSTVSGLVCRLESKEIIKKISKGTHSEITLTSQTLNKIEELNATRHELQDKLYSGFSSGEKKNINKYLDKFIKNMEDALCGKK